MRKVFIDCGSNKGKVTRQFIDGGDIDYEYYLFEPLPYFHDVYNIGDILRKQYPDIKIEYFQKAVGDENKTVEFYLCTKGNEGSSLCDNKFSNKMDKEKPIRVEMIDFNEWILNNFDKDDYIKCKIDIEGYEYKLIPHMINGGSISYINEIMVEFHGRKQLKTTENQHKAYKEINEYFEKSDIKFSRWW